MLPDPSILPIARPEETEALQETRMITTLRVIVDMTCEYMGKTVLEDRS